MSPVKHHAILAIGGAEDKVHGKEILHTFFERSGGTAACIGIIPCASRDPVAISARYQQIFADMGAPETVVMDIRDRAQGEDPSWKTTVEPCTGVFITGGDQVRLCGLLADTPLIDIVRQRAQLGEITLGGTSAGAAVMGHHMIAGGGSGESPNRSLVDMAIGLGFVPEVIVDQHFHNRNRMARLMSAMAMQPSRLGLGIDEDTCALFEGDGSFQVIGKGVIAVVDPSAMIHTNEPDITAADPLSIHGLRLHLLAHGDRFDINHRKVLATAKS
ncbi:cyanophycinase [Leptolyngbya sp. CCNP1308]|uniref:cyanophycinase n=1 Tax=Leptolyngbya sp. CCNP1308 TaxID=3110255 RepID=UPI002B1F7100|nr:cyanophycinase [Leptolyngbya sp. CCNP1308]MEA5451197.1 cyanophycinase [Leptolyngbya sp. CCNP1308]